MPHMQRFGLAGLLILSAAAAIAAPLQGDIALTSFTIDCGGLSTTGFAAISGTIGQPEASVTMTGGAYRLAGGFWALPAPPQPQCPGDVDGDGSVGAPDIAILLGAWGTTDAAADLNEDGTVGAPDLALLLGAWGPCDVASPLR